METLPPAEFACAEVWGGNGRIRRDVLLPGLEGSVLSQPCLSGHGGDVYYVSACSSGLYARVYLADVAGHGEDVAGLSAWLHDTLRRRINQHDTGRIFSRVNRHVVKRGYRALTTAACFTYDARRGEMNYCYAGHPPMLRFHARDGRWAPLTLEKTEAPDVRNAAFGVARDASYDVGRCTLEPGDRILLYSDGLTEAPDAQRALFGDDGLLRCLAEAPAEGCSALVDALIASLHRHAGKEVLDHDDITVLAFTVRPRVTGSILLTAIRNRIRRRRIHRQTANATP